MIKRKNILSMLRNFFQRYQRMKYDILERLSYQKPKLNQLRIWIEANKEEVSRLRYITCLTRILQKC